MSHAAYIAQYDVPVADPTAERPTLNWPPEGLRRGRSALRRRPRLAYIDSHFPWQRSGFRYADALAIFEARPDTVFFSMYEMRDTFPVPVLPLADFPSFALSLGITDVYGVFLGFMAGVLGLREEREGELGPIEGIDLSEVLRYAGIRAHVGLYPGGGFVTSEAGLMDARRVVAAADRVFSWAPAVLDHVEGVSPIDPAIIDTTFYEATPRSWAARPLQLLYVADAAPRKGLSVALAALHELADEPVHLHVVGPHDPQNWTGPKPRATFHGWLQREELRDLHRRCHVFVSPVGRERVTDGSGDGTVTDGFPTAAAGEAASSGCLLISGNPDADHRALRAGIDYVEVPATSTAFAEAVRSVLADPAAAAAVASSGARRVRQRLDVKVGAATRLELMGLGVDRPGASTTPALSPVFPHDAASEA
jgi:glycosyltransferase involved in cell wall biosynthesis